MARQRNPKTLDNRMDEQTTAFLIHCHSRFAFSATMPRSQVCTPNLKFVASAVPEI